MARHEDDEPRPLKVSCRNCGAACEEEAYGGLCMECSDEEDRVAAELAHEAAGEALESEGIDEDIEVELETLGLDPEAFNKEHRDG